MDDLQIYFNKLSLKEKRKLPSYDFMEIPDESDTDSNSETDKNSEIDDSDMEMEDAVFCSSNSVLNIIIRAHAFKNEIRLNMSKKTLKILKNTLMTSSVYAWILKNGGSKTGNIIGYSKIKSVGNNILYVEKNYDHIIKFSCIKKLNRHISSHKLILKLSDDLNDYLNNVLRNFK